MNPTYVVKLFDEKIASIHGKINFYSQLTLLNYKNGLRILGSWSNIEPAQTEIEFTGKHGEYHTANLPFPAIKHRLSNSFGLSTIYRVNNNGQFLIIFCSSASIETQENISKILEKAFFKD